MSIQKIIRGDSQPFAMIPNSAIRNPEITTNAFRLLAYLMSHQDGYELTYEQIERQTTLGRWAINQAAANLTALGYLRLERPQQSNGQFGPKHWTILDPDTSSTTVDHSTMETPHMGESTDNKENNLSKKTTNKDISSNEFDLFWELYPRKTGKGAAKRAYWKAVSQFGSTTILAGVTRMSKDPNLPEQTFIPYPATWLNSEGWENEPYPERKRTPEELEKIRREKSEKEREANARASKERLAESERARANAAKEIPKCEHGNTIARCIRCLNKKS